MLSLFKIASQDQSVVYLGQIFGVVSPGLLAPKEAPMLLGILFKVFNTSVLTLGAVMVIYVTIVGLMKTAKEGEFLGKQWSSLWMPLRMVFGIGALIPLPTGYSAIQVLFMWIILQGVGAADTLWSAVMNYNIVAGAPTGQQQIPDLNNIGLNAKMQDLYKGLVCQAEAARMTAATTPVSGVQKSLEYYCGVGANKSTSFCSLNGTTTTPDGVEIAIVPTSLSTYPEIFTYNMGPGTPPSPASGNNPASQGTGSCGQLTYCNESVECNPAGQTIIKRTRGRGGRIVEKRTHVDYSPAACQTCKAQKALLNQIIPVMANIAEKTAETDDQYTKWYQYSTINLLGRNIANSEATAPDWILNYCQRLNPAITDGSCVTGNQAPSLFDTANSSYDPQNASEALAKVYWTYSISPWLAGYGGTSKVQNFIAPIVDQYKFGFPQTIVLNNQGFGAQQWQMDALNQGWIFAGGYFYQIIQEGAKDIAAKVPVLSVTSTSSSSPSPSSPMNSTYRSNYTAAGYILRQIASEIKNASSADGGEASSSGLSLSSTSSEFSSVTSTIGDGAVTILKSFQDNLTSNISGKKDASGNTINNPLISIGKFGYQLMITVQLLFWALLAITFGLVAVFTINPLALGTGLTMNPIGEAIKSALGMVSPFFIAMLAGLYSLGAIFGIYVPLIPFMVFSMGAVGWILATVEAMVAAPIVALGLLSPGGQSEVFGRAEPALMLVLNLFLRPGLMIIGLMAGTIVSVPVVTLINTAFLATTKSVMSNPGIFEQALFLVIYASFIVTVINKCYSLIYIIPERVLTWIGGQAVQYGEAEALQAAKHAVEGGAGAIEGAGKEGGAAATHAGTMARRAYEDKGAAVQAQQAKRAEVSHKQMFDKSRGEDAAAAHKAMVNKANKNDKQSP